MVKQSFELIGNWVSREVFLDKRELSPGASLAVINHSPDGFAWGYGGSGPGQLALAICLKLLGKEKAIECYQDFKTRLIARLPQTNFSIKFVIIDGDWRNPVIVENLKNASVGQ